MAPTKEDYGPPTAMDPQSPEAMWSAATPVGVMQDQPRPKNFIGSKSGAPRPTREQALGAAKASQVKRSATNKAIEKAAKPKPTRSQRKKPAKGGCEVKAEALEESDSEADNPPTVAAGLAPILFKGATFNIRGMRIKNDTRKDPEA